MCLLPSSAEIAPVIDSFFDASWEGFALTAQSGKDNAPGATRTFSFGGALDLTEQLVSNVCVPVCPLPPFCWRSS